jgi:hypothetical protein
MGREDDMKDRKNMLRNLYELFLVVVILFAAYRLYDAGRQIYRSSDDFYRKQFGNAYAGNIDLEELQEVNSDIVGWLIVDDAQISYPVLQDRELHADYMADGIVNTEANTDPAIPRMYRLYRYLYYDFEKKPSASGSVTIDFKNTLEDPYLLIYGHNAEREGVMFSDLLKMQDQAFFDLCGDAALYGEEGKTDLHLLACALISGYSEEVFAFDPYHGHYPVKIAVQFIEENAICLSEAASVSFEERPYSRYVVLSTCFTTPEDPRRFVVLYGAE